MTLAMRVIAVLLATVATPAAFPTASVAEAQTPRREVVAVRQDGKAVTAYGRISGYESVDHVVRARAGDSLRVRLNTDRTSNYFNVLPPGADTALFVGSIGGSGFAARLPASGDYVMRVYLMRGAARRGVTARYQLSVWLWRAAAAASPSAPRAPASHADFDSSLALHGVTFRVRGVSEITGSRLTITPSGLTADSAPVARLVPGLVSGAEVSDLDVDGSPELWVYVRTRDPRHPQRVVAYAANRRRSLSEITVPSEPVAASEREGYRGFDEFRVVGDAFVRRFPLFADSEGAPTGRTRQIEYRLARGEAGWLLRTRRVLER